MDSKAIKAKIAFFLPSLEPGGAERNVINLLKNLDREKYRVSLVLQEKKGDFIKEVPKDVSIVNLGVFRSLPYFFKIRKYLREERPDIFVSLFPRFNIINLLAKIFSRTETKIVLTEQTTISLLPFTAKTPLNRFIARFFLPFLVKVLYPRAKAIICVSKGVAKDLSRCAAVSKKIRVIYNPVVGARIQEKAREPVEGPYFSGQEEPVILAVGRLTKAKDYPNLFYALKKVLQKQKARLIILGEGQERKKLEELCQKLDLTENVAFLGFQENPYKFMKEATVFVLSSSREGFGNVIVEAMACGLPVVSTDCPSGPGEIIDDGKAGLLVPPRNPEALARAILKLLNNPVLRDKLAKRGKERAKDFTVEKSVGEYERIFGEILS